MKKLLLVLSVIFLASAGYSQNLKIGVRTGLGFYKLMGELEENESQSLASGFHFAITGAYRLTDNFGVRTELSYVQKSSLQEYNDRFLTVFYVNNPNGDNRIKTHEYGGTKYTLKRTFNIFSIPLHAYYKPTRKIELFGGVDLDFAAGVIGQGRIEFNNGKAEGEGEIFYNQVLNYNYGQDRLGQGALSGGSIVIDYDEDGDGETEKVELPKTLTAYFYNESDEGKAYSTFDLALTGGVSYFINPGLYVRGTGHYGLLDSTKSAFDHSLQDVNLDSSYIFRDDNDHKIGFQISVGFQF